MKRIFTLIALVAATLATTAQNRQLDAEYKLYRESFTINEDGTTDYNFRKELTLYTNRAMTAYATNGETFIVYNPATEYLTINESYTIRPDGTRVETPKNAFIEQLPEGCKDCARYNNIREMVVVHTGLELGCTIVLDYTIHRSTHDVLGSIVLAEDYPVQRYEVHLECAEKYQYLVQPINLDRIKYTTSGNKGEFNIVAYDVPARMIDSYLPADDEIYPILYLSDILEEELLFFYNGTTENKYLEYGKKIEGYDELLANLKGKDDKETVVNIRNWVVSNVTNVLLPYFSDDYAIDENSTWNENCGIPSAKIPLVAALLQKAGFKTEIQWGYTKMPVVNNLQFVLPDNKTTRLNVTIDGGQYLLNPLKIEPLENPTAETADENPLIIIDKNLEWKGTEIANGYSKMVLPRDAKALRLNLSLLTTLRTNPLKCKPTSESYHYAINLPKDAKMVSKTINKELSFPGIGSCKVVIEPKGQTIDVVRKLVIENGNIGVAQYPQFRKLIELWESTNEIIVK